MLRRFKGTWNLFSSLVVQVAFGREPYGETSGRSANVLRCPERFDCFCNTGRLAPGRYILCVLRDTGRLAPGRYTFVFFVTPDGLRRAATFYVLRNTGRLAPGRYIFCVLRNTGQLAPGRYIFCVLRDTGRLAPGRYKLKRHV
ncbi:MAG: hypothetical protein AAFN77_07540 [Planctomycetota bacterium]